MFNTINIKLLLNTQRANKLLVNYLETVSLYWGISFAKSNLFEGESLPSLWSEVEHESINVWAITDKHESTVGVLSMSNMKSGFLMKFTQNLNGRL